MRPGSLSYLRKVFEGKEVVKGVVSKDGIKRTTKPERTHVSEHVLTFRIDRAAHRKHLRRDVCESKFKVSLHVRGVVASPAPKLQQSLWTWSHQAH